MMQTKELSYTLLYSYTGHFLSRVTQLHITTQSHWIDVKHKMCLTSQNVFNRAGSVESQPDVLQV